MDICDDTTAGLTVAVPPGVPLHRLLRAAADLGGQPQGAAAERRLLRRGEERRRGPLRPGRVRHLPARVPEGVPDRGHDQRTVHVRLGNYQGSRWKYFSLQGRPEDRIEPQRRGREDCHPLPVRLAGKSSVRRARRRRVACQYCSENISEYIGQVIILVGSPLRRNLE